MCATFHIQAVRESDNSLLTSDFGEVLAVGSIVGVGCGTMVGIAVAGMSVGTGLATGVTRIMSGCEVQARAIKRNDRKDSHCLTIGRCPLVVQVAHR